MAPQQKRMFRKDILKHIYDEGLEATCYFKTHFGPLKVPECVRVFTTPICDLLVERAAWGELAIKYAFWAHYLHKNNMVQDAKMMQHAIADLLRIIDPQEQSDRAWYITGLQVASLELETTSAQNRRYTAELDEHLKKACII